MASYGYDQPGDEQRGIAKEPTLPPYQPSRGFNPPSQAGYPAPQAGSPPPRQWGTPLFSCFDDMPICLCGAFCGPCLASQVSEDMGEHYCMPYCGQGTLVALRLKMRMQENIEGSLMNDHCTVAFCRPCALCQLAREVKIVQQHQMVITNQPC